MLKKIGVFAMKRDQVRECLKKNTNKQNNRRARGEATTMIPGLSSDGERTQKMGTSKASIRGFLGGSLAAQDGNDEGRNGPTGNEAIRFEKVREFSKRINRGPRR